MSVVTLETWAKREFTDKVPSIYTLRKWARDGKIVPVPEKRGRTYYVSPVARFVNTNDPEYNEKAAKALHESTQAQHG